VNRLRQVANPEAEVTTWSYDGDNRVTALRLANGARTSYVYDLAGRLLRLANLGPGGATLSSFDYTYDAANNRTRVVEDDGDTTRWTYDNTYQLLAEKRSGADAYAVTYTYDPAGNRLTTWDGTVRSTCTYNDANQITLSTPSVGLLKAYRFDDAGNLMRTYDATNLITYGFDGENRLTRFRPRNFAGTNVTFTYNGLGQRIQAQDSGGVVKFAWDGSDVVIERDAGNVVQAVYTKRPDLYGTLVSLHRGTATSTYHYDGLGSTRQLTDAYLYRAFGESIAASGTTTNPYRFVGEAGYQTDTTWQVQYLRGRWYEPATGRFLSRDPIGFANGDWNLYRYVGGNPLNYIDPFGFAKTSETA
jgi:RHS repeat-associated protein